MAAPDGHGLPVDVGELLSCSEETPDLRSAALMNALQPARKELVPTPTHTLIDSPVQILIADLIADSGVDEPSALMAKNTTQTTAAKTRAKAEGKILES